MRGQQQRSGTQNALQSYSCWLTKQYDFSSSQAPRPLLNSTVQRHQLHCKPTEDSRVQAKWHQYRQQDFLTLANRATAEVLLRAQWTASFFVERKIVQPDSYTSTPPFTAIHYPMKYDQLAFLTPFVFCNVNKYCVNNIFVVIILVELLSCNQHSFELQTFWAWILSSQTGFYEI